MIFKSILSAACTCLAVVSFNVDAALVSRLGGQAYYDDVADLTWLTDGNYLYTNAYIYDMYELGVMGWGTADNLASAFKYRWSYWMAAT